MLDDQEGEDEIPIANSVQQNTE